LQHLLNFEFQAQPRSLQIDIDDLVPIFFSLFNDGFPIAFDACVVESDVETSEFFDGFLDLRLNIGGFCSVGFDDESIAASSVDEQQAIVKRVAISPELDSCEKNPAIAERCRRKAARRQRTSIRSFRSRRDRDFPSRLLRQLLELREKQWRPRSCGSSIAGAA